MRFKRDGYRLNMTRPRAGNDLVQNMGMRPVHSVKIAHTDQSRSKASRNFVEFVEDLH